MYIVIFVSYVWVVAYTLLGPPRAPKNRKIKIRGEGVRCGSRPGGLRCCYQRLRGSRGFGGEVLATQVSPAADTRHKLTEWQMPVVRPMVGVVVATNGTGIYPTDCPFPWEIRLGNWVRLLLVVRLFG